MNPIEKRLNQGVSIEKLREVFGDEVDKYKPEEKTDMACKGGKKKGKGKGKPKGY